MKIVSLFHFPCWTSRKRSK